MNELKGRGGNIHFAQSMATSFYTSDDRKLAELRRYAENLFTRGGLRQLLPSTFEGSSPGPGPRPSPSPEDPAPPLR